MIKLLKNIYTKLQNTKQHLWSHSMAIWGWVFLILSTMLLISYFTDDNLGIDYIQFAIFVAIAFTSYWLIVCFIILIIESLFFRKFKIKWAFLTKNPFYNVFWTIGITSTIMNIIFILACCLHYGIA